MDGQVPRTHVRAQVDGRAQEGACGNTEVVSLSRHEVDKTYPLPVSS
jgi:hypothetical protein